MKLKTLVALLGVCGVLYIGTEYIKISKTETVSKQEQDKPKIEEGTKTEAIINTTTLSSDDEKKSENDSEEKTSEKENVILLSQNKNQEQNKIQNTVQNIDPLKDIGKVNDNQLQEQNQVQDQSQEQSKENDFTEEEKDKSFIELTDKDNELFFEGTLQLKEDENIKKVSKITFEPQVLFSLKEKVEFDKQVQYDELFDSLPPHILETNAQYNERLSKNGPFKEEHEGGELIQEKDQLLNQYIIPFAHFEAETSSLKSDVNWLDFILTREMLKNVGDESFSDKSAEEFLKENNLDLSKIENEDISKEDVDKINQIAEKMISPGYVYELNLMKDKENFDYANKEYVEKLNLENYSAKTKILNFFIDKYIYLGGAHGMSYIHPINIDLTTKETVNVTDVLNFSNDSLRKINDTIFLINKKQYHDSSVVLETNDIEIKEENKEVQNGKQEDNSLYKGSDLIKSQNITFKDNKTQAEYEKYKALSSLLKDALVKYRTEVENESVMHIKDEKERQKALEEMQNATNKEYGGYEVYPSFDFFVLDNGLTFVYQPYAILPYAYGFVELFISYEDLIKNNLLTKDFLERIQN